MDSRTLRPLGVINKQFTYLCIDLLIFVLTYLRHEDVVERQESRTDPHGDPEINDPSPLLLPPFDTD